MISIVAVTSVLTVFVGGPGESIAWANACLDQWAANRAACKESEQQDIATCDANLNLTLSDRPGTPAIGPRLWYTLGRALCEAQGGGTSDPEEDVCGEMGQDWGEAEYLVEAYASYSYCRALAWRNASNCLVDANDALDRCRAAR